MRHPFPIRNFRKALTLLVCGTLAAVPVLAGAQTYSEPSRGFFIERGNIVADTPSIDLLTGSFGTAGALRLGLPNSELILNGALSSDADNADNADNLGPGLGGADNEIIFKFGLPRIAMEGGMDLAWAAYGGLSYYDDDTPNQDDRLNVVAGLAATLTIDRLILTGTPELVIADDNRDDTFLDFGLGAHFNIPTTRVGTFQPGIELIATTGDGEDILAIGSRWLYNDRLTLDLNVALLGDNDSVSIPGYARLNFAF